MNGSVRAHKTSKGVYLGNIMWWCLARDCDVTIANSYKQSNADARCYYAIGTDRRQLLGHVVHLQSMLSLLELALKLGSLVTNGCSTQ